MLCSKQFVMPSMQCKTAADSEQHLQVSYSSGLLFLHQIYLTEFETLFDIGFIGCVSWISLIAVHL